MAGVGRIQGYTDMSSTGIGQLTQKVYSKKTLIKFYKTTVFGDISNTDYEGEIKGKGDTIIIRTVPDVTIRDYVKGQELVYETPESAAIEMQVDKAKYFACKIDKIDERLTDIKWMDKWTEDGAKQMGINIDRTILSQVYADASSFNTGATAGKVSASYALGTAGTQLVPTITAGSLGAVELMMDCEAVLSEQDVPEDNERFFVAPGWFINRLQKGDLRRSDSNAAGSQDVLRNGKIGQIGGFNLFRTNNYSPVGGTAYPILFGHKSALTFAAEIIETESLPHPTAFGSILRSLMVYGYKVIKPEALGILWVKPA